jgi:threonine dehydratase
MLWSLFNLTPPQKDAGVITFSAGNAAQGLAYAAAIVGTRATVVMPEGASPAKAEATRGYGGEVIFHGSAADCLAHCRRLSQEKGLTFVSSYDDHNLMEGHASLGSEILEDVPEASAIFVGVGGGGMMGGLAKMLLAAGSAARLIGVEPEGAPAMYRSLEEGRPAELDRVQTIADGLAAPTAGKLCFELARQRLEKIVLVTDDQIQDAMRLLMSRAKVLAEPAGAASLAGLLAGGHGLGSRDKVVVVASGGNIDLERLKTLL